MSKTVLCAIALCGVLWNRLPAADPATPPSDAQALEELFARLGQPGPQHEQMKIPVGKWDCVGRSYEQDASSPVEWKGSAEFTSLMGGRYIQQDFRGEMPGM